jgi:hypothetical protein
MIVKMIMDVTCGLYFFEGDLVVMYVSVFLLINIEMWKNTTNHNTADSLVGIRNLITVSRMNRMG